MDFLTKNIRSQSISSPHRSRQPMRFILAYKSLYPIYPSSSWDFVSLSRLRLYFCFCSSFSIDRTRGRQTRHSMGSRDVSRTMCCFPLLSLSALSTMSLMFASMSIPLHTKMRSAKSGQDCIYHNLSRHPRSCLSFAFAISILGTT